MTKKRRSPLLHYLRAFFSSYYFVPVSTGFSLSWVLAWVVWALATFRDQSLLWLLIPALLAGNSSYASDLACRPFSFCLPGNLKKLIPLNLIPIGMFAVAIGSIYVYCTHQQSQLLEFLAGLPIIEGQGAILPPINEPDLVFEGVAFFFLSTALAMLRLAYHTRSRERSLLRILFWSCSFAVFLVSLLQNKTTLLHLEPLPVALPSLILIFLTWKEVSRFDDRTFRRYHCLRPAPPVSRDITDISGYKNELQRWRSLSFVQMTGKSPGVLSGALLKVLRRRKKPFGKAFVGILLERLGWVSNNAVVTLATVVALFPFFLNWKPSLAWLYAPILLCCFTAIPSMSQPHAIRLPISRRNRFYASIALHLCSFVIVSLLFRTSLLVVRLESIPSLSIPTSFARQPQVDCVSVFSGFIWTLVASFPFYLLCELKQRSDYRLAGMTCLHLLMPVAMDLYATADPMAVAHFILMSVVGWTLFADHWKDEMVGGASPKGATP